MSRLSGSFLVIAVVLIGLSLGYPQSRQPLPTMERLLCAVAGAVALALGLAGIRARRKYFAEAE